MRPSEFSSKKCADLAVKTLSEAIDAGFRNITSLVGEPAFQQLRSRTDFQQSVIRMMDLTFPADPFCRSKSVSVNGTSLDAHG